MFDTLKKDGVTESETMSSERRVKKSILEQMIAISSLIFAVILIFIIAIPQALQALLRLIYYHRKGDVQGKLAIVIGGGSELGRLIANKLAERGCNLVIVDEDSVKIKKVAEEVNRKNVKVAVYCARTCENQDVFRLFDEVSEKFGDIDLLINTPQLLSSESDSARTMTEKMSANFNSTMLVTLKFLEKLERQTSSSHIVCISSCAGFSDSPNGSSDELAFGFMSSVNDYLRERKLQKKIATTSVVPCFVQNGAFITKHLNKFFKFNPIDADAMADEIIKGITHKDSLIEIPNNLTNLTKLVVFILKLMLYSFWL